jgi:hypothetical protein
MIINGFHSLFYKAYVSSWSVSNPLFPINFETSSKFSWNLVWYCVNGEHLTSALIPYKKKQMMDMKITDVGVTLTIQCMILKLYMVTTYCENYVVLLR